LEHEEPRDALKERTHGFSRSGIGGLRRSQTGGFASPSSRKRPQMNRSPKTRTNDRRHDAVNRACANAR
jgi:hypothetical protein